MLSPKYWFVPFLLGVILWFGLPSHSCAAAPVDPKILHVLNRLSFGPRPGDIDRIAATGIKAYIQSQLQPESIPYSAELRRQLDGLETLQMSPVPLLKNPDLQQSNQQSAQEKRRNSRMWTRKVFDQSVEARLRRAIGSDRQLEEVMVEFWFNHFNVFAGNGLSRLWVGAYEREAIRPHVFGHFRDLLGATARHPAMLFYLDNWLNSAPNSKRPRGKFRGLNENYARELMELHTLGVDGGYSQDDIVACCRIFTGWSMTRSARQAGNDSGFHFDANRHDFSDKVFLGTTIKGRGIAEGEQALDILARHPSTARHISYKLAQYFVADEPPANLVNSLERRFRQTDGDIRAVLETLFESGEFWNHKYYNSKFKTPYQYIISAVRATGAENPQIKSLFGALRQMEMPLYGCRTPNGYKNTRDAWLNPDAILRRVSFATLLGQGRWVGGKVDAAMLAKTLGNNFSDRTLEVIETSPVKLRSGLILGSPEMMRR